MKKNTVFYFNIKLGLNLVISMRRTFKSMFSWKIINKDKSNYRFLLIVLAILFALISGVTIFNTKNLKYAINEKTKSVCFRCVFAIIK